MSMRIILISLFTWTLIACGQETESSSDENKMIHSEDPIVVPDTVAVASHDLSKPVFIVDTVIMDSTPIAEQKAVEVVEQKLMKRVTFLGKSSVDSLISVRNNSFIETFQIAYDEHRPITFTPESFWLTILQGIAIHLKENEDLRKSLIKENVERTLVSKTGDSTLSYNVMTKMISGCTNQLIAGITIDKEKLTPIFSTNNLSLNIAMKLTVMSSFDQEFTYVGETGCGFPRVEIAGTKEDWEKILCSIELLDEFDLTWWKKEMITPLKKIISCFDGDIDVPYFQECFKNSKDYNQFHIAGWIIKFFPYIKTAVEVKKKLSPSMGADDFDNAVIKYELNPFAAKTDYLLSNLNTNDFPTGIFKADFIHKDLIDGSETAYELHAGFFGVVQDSNLSLSPYINWAASKGAKDEQIDVNVHWSGMVPKPEHPNFWSSKIINTPKVPPLLNGREVYSNDSVCKQIFINDLGLKVLKGGEFSFVVLSNGTIAEVECSKRISKAILTAYLSKNDFYWQPGMEQVGEVFRTLDHRPIGREMFKVNTKLSFSF